jgi:hypothetical protein
MVGIDLDWAKKSGVEFHGTSLNGKYCLGRGNVFSHCGSSQVGVVGSSHPLISLIIYSNNCTPSKYLYATRMKFIDLTVVIELLTLLFV